MKHLLLILISFLLFSSPVIGNSHKGETLYMWKNISGIGYVWKGFGDKETHSVYKGEVEFGRPNGLGFLISPDGGDKYVGSWKNGKYHGEGTETFFDGSKVIGEWKNNILWNGTFYDKDGIIKFRKVNGKYDN